MAKFEDVTCTLGWDLTSDFVQSGSTFSGTMSYVGRTVNCGVELPLDLASFLGQGSSLPITGTASGGSLMFGTGPAMFTGTYTATRIDATWTFVQEGVTVNYTWRQNKQ
jgi:hypothetical protein